MGDRWGYSRSYGGSSKPRYPSSTGSSNSYARVSGERDGSRERDSYGSTTNHFYSADYNSRSSGNINPAYTRYARERSPSSRQYEESSSRFRESDDSGWEKTMRVRERSPTPYINRSPPRPSYTDRPHQRSRNSQSPLRGHSTTFSSRLHDWDDKIPPVPYHHHLTNSSWNKAEGFVGRFDRRPKEPLPEDPFNSKSAEIVKLVARLKEYVPWLTSRKTSIFEQRRDKDFKDEVDDIDWCLDVIQDINADENVGMITIKRAQEMVMGLISKGPISTQTTPANDFVRQNETRVESVVRDDIYSARSPSPPSFVSERQYSRRNELPDSNPRVIPTDRSEFYFANSSSATGPKRNLVVNPLATSRNEGFLYSQRGTPSDRDERTLPNDRDERVIINDRFERTIPNDRLQLNSTIIPTERFVSNPRPIPVERVDSSLSSSRTIGGAENAPVDWDYVPGVNPPPPTVDNTVYEYDHGQTMKQNKKEEVMFERRKPKTEYIPPQREQAAVDQESSWKEPVTQKAQIALDEAEMERRLKEWEDSSDEDEIVIIRKGKKPQDQDMRVYVAESRPTKTKSKSSVEEIRSPDKSEVVSEFNMYGFVKDVINPASLHSRPPLAQGPLFPPVQPPPPQPVVHPLMNMNQPLFNPFLNPGMPNLSGLTASQMITFQTQAQMFMGFPQARPPTGSGMIPMPCSNIPPTNLPPFRFPNTSSTPARASDPLPLVHTQTNAIGQTQEEIMMSRIKARAAESFRVKRSYDGQTHAREPTDPHASNQESTPTNPTPMAPPAQVLDPRLKPRVPREIQDIRRNDQEEDRLRKIAVERQQEESVRRSSGDRQNDKDRRLSGDRQNNDHKNQDQHPSIDRLNDQKDEQRSSVDRQNENRMRRVSGDRQNGSNWSYSEERWESRERVNSGDRQSEGRYRRPSEDIERDDSEDRRGKRGFVNPPNDRSRRVSGDGRVRQTSGGNYHDNRGRRISGDEYNDRCRLSGDQDEREERVSRNFTRRDRDLSFLSASKSEAQNKTDTHIQEDSEIPAVPVKFPSLSARIEAVRDKLNQTTIEKNTNSGHSRVDEIRREAEILHPIGTISRNKTAEILTAPKTHPVEEKVRRGRKARFSSTSSDEKKPKKGKVRDDVIQITTEEEKSPTRVLRRSPRKRVSVVKEVEPTPIHKQSLTKSQENAESVKGEVSPVFRIPKLKKSDSEPVIIEVEDESYPESDEDQLRIDISESPLIIEENLYEMAKSPDSGQKEKVILAEADERSIPAKAVSKAESPDSGQKQKVVSTEADVHNILPKKLSLVEAVPEPSKSILPAGADELIKSLLLSSLSPEEAEVLSSSDDYLATTLARLKEELSAKVKEKAKQISSAESAESSVSSTTLLDKVAISTADSKDDDERGDDCSRSRTLVRRKPQSKRRSSLEKLHDALREMNFDSMMPLGPRRTQVKLAVEEQVSESKEVEKSVEGGKVPIPKLSPIVVLESVDIDASSKVPGTTDLPLLEKGVKKAGPIKKRKYVSVKKRKATGEVETSLISKGKTSLNQSSPPNKRRKLTPRQVQMLAARTSESTERPVTRSSIIIGPRDVVVNEGIENEKEESLNFPDMEMMDLGTDLGLGEDDNLPFKPEDFHLSLSDDDLPNLKPEDFVISTEFMINDTGLDNITIIKSEPVDSAGISSKKQAELMGEKICEKTVSSEPRKRRGRKKKKQTISECLQTCVLCPFFGKKVIEHYVNEHPGQTVPPACLTEDMFGILAQRNTSDSPQLMEIRYKLSDTIRCLFCGIILSSIPVYCNHLTSHTGEFRFKCTVCEVKFPNKLSGASHLKAHKKDVGLQVSSSIIETKVPMEEDENEFYGYLCRECNYFQILSENIRSHLDLTKHSETDVVCIKFKGANKIVMGDVRIKTVVEPPEFPKLESNTSGLLEENLKSVFCAKCEEPLPTPIVVECHEVSRFKAVKRDHIEELLARYAEITSRDAPAIEALVPVSVPKIFESDTEILAGATYIVEWVLDKVSLPEECELEIKKLNKHLEELEAFPFDEPFSPLYIPDSPFTNNTETSSEHDGDDDDIEINDIDRTEEDDEELNDFYVDPPSFLDGSEPNKDSIKPISERTDSSEPITSESMELFKSSSISSKSPFSLPRSNSFLNTSTSSMPGSVECQSVDDDDKSCNLDGLELYRCGYKGCFVQRPNIQALKEHFALCRFQNRFSIDCFHCQKKFKTVPAFTEHLNIHGKRKHVCAICSQRCRMSSSMNKHFRDKHKINGFKLVRHNLPFDGDVLCFPREAFNKPVELQQLQDSPMLYVPRIQFLPEEFEDVPKQSVLTACVHCALCNYSTRVSVNMSRHMSLHRQAEESGSTPVPTEAPVNPVPWLERKELMFDKMTNWAGSTHKHKEDMTMVLENEKVPEFVPDQFRYVCSVTNCSQITVDDSMLRAHMKALHSEYDLYACPHCRANEFTRGNPHYTVSIEKIGAHLKLHGSKLLKCGHCDFVSIQTKVIEKHVSEKHVEKKPIHYVIRNHDGENTAGSSSRRGSVDEPTKNSERWKCAVCKVVNHTWEQMKEHCQEVHRIKSQFMCNTCRYSTNSIYQVSNHILSQSCAGSPLVLVYFFRSELGEDKVRYPIWRRANAREHLRGIFYLPETEVKESGSGQGKPVSQATKGTPALLRSSVKLKQTEIAAKPKVKVSAGKRKPKIITQMSKDDDRKFVCCQCNTYKSKTAEAMRVHLRQHLNYHRYTCSLCGNRCWTLTSFKLHVEVDHMRTYDTQFLIIEPVDPTLERQLKEWLSRSVPDPLELDSVVPVESKSQVIQQTKLDQKKIVYCEEITILD